MSMIRQIDFQRANKLVQKAIRSDDGLFIAYQANIAMAFVDCARWYKERTGKRSLSNRDIFLIANEAADYFLKQWTAKASPPPGR